MQDTDYQSILDEIDAQQSQMEDLLAQWSNINSGSFHLSGLSQQADAIESLFSTIASVERVELPAVTLYQLDGEPWSFQSIPALVMRINPHAACQVMLCGHCDTVFGHDHPFQQAKRLPNNLLNGPGVADMKGGILVIYQALRACLASSWADKLGFTVVINPDEEIGSPCSQSLLQSLAPQHQFGLVYEPSLNMAGDVASERKGSGKFTCVVQGKAAHAGRDFAQGRSAVLALATLLLEIDQLNGQQPGLTINIGQIQGGKAVNIVPDKAVCKIDVRYSQPEQTQWLQKHLTQSVQQANQQQGIDVSLHGGFNRPVKLFDQHQQTLFNLLKQAGEQLSIPLHWQAGGGCCDGNNLAAQGLAVIDSLGVRGANIHTDREIMDLGSLSERAKLSAMLLMMMAKKYG